MRSTKTAIQQSTLASPVKLGLAVFVIILIFQACGIARVSTNDSTPDRRSTDRISAESGRILQSGIASWYGPNFHGKATANGETFNMNDYTAAHRTLPFNTIVLVENMDNGESVTVRINDRGPYVDDRVIDLSRRAARTINMEDTGTARVQLILLEEGDRPVAPGPVTNQETFTIQLASYNSQAEAERFSRQIRGTRVEAVQVAGQTIYRVYYGTYRTAIEARDDQRRLARRGLDAFVKQAEN